MQLGQVAEFQLRAEMKCCTSGDKREQKGGEINVRAHAATQVLKAALPSCLLLHMPGGARC
jgi:hypothetical protein